MPHSQAIAFPSRSHTGHSCHHTESSNLPPSIHPSLRSTVPGSNSTQSTCPALAIPGQGERKNLTSLLYFQRQGDRQVRNNPPTDQRGVPRRETEVLIGREGQKLDKQKSDTSHTLRKKRDKWPASFSPVLKQAPMHLHPFIQQIRTNYVQFPFTEDTIIKSSQIISALEEINNCHSRYYLQVSTCHMHVLVNYCGIKSCAQNLVAKTTHIYYSPVYMSQESRHNIAGPLLQSLYYASVKVPNELQQSPGSAGEGPASKIPHMAAGRIQFLESYWPETTLSPLPCRFLLYGSSLSGSMQDEKAIGVLRRRKVQSFIT